MLLRGQEWDVLCVVGSEEESSALLKRALAFARNLGAHLTIAESSGRASRRDASGDAGFISDVASIGPTSCAITTLSSAEKGAARALEELMVKLSPDILMVPGDFVSSTESAWFTPNTAWQITSELGCALLIVRPPIHPASIVMLTDFGAQNQAIMELAAELGRSMSTDVRYIAAHSDAEGVVEPETSLKGVCADLLVLGLPPGAIPTPSALVRQTSGSVLLVPLPDVLLH